MRKIKEVLRLKHDVGLSHEKIAGAVGLSKGAVAKYVSLAAACGSSGRRRAPRPSSKHSFIPPRRR